MSDDADRFCGQADEFREQAAKRPPQLAASSRDPNLSALANHRTRLCFRSTTRVKSTIVFSLMTDGEGLSQLPDLRQVAAGQDCASARCNAGITSLSQEPDFVGPFSFEV